MKITLAIMLILLSLLTLGCGPDYDKIALRQTPELVKEHLKCPATAIFSKLRLDSSYHFTDSITLRPIDSSEQKRVKDAYDAVDSIKIVVGIAELERATWTKKCEVAEKYSTDLRQQPGVAALWARDWSQNQDSLKAAEDALSELIFRQVELSEIANTMTLNSQRGAVLRKVIGNVDSQNAYGAMVRTPFTLLIEISPDGKQAKVLSIELDDDP